MNAIKESFDNLPTAVCIFDRKGLVRMMNRRMLAVGAMLLGSGIQTLPELREALDCLPPGVTADGEAPGVYHFPDGSALRFSEREIVDGDGQPFVEVTACDVSELMAVRARLRQENERLSQANRRLRKLGEDMADIVRREEILNMKIRVHDDVGYSLLGVRRAYWECGDVEALHKLAEQWRTTIRLLHADRPDRSDDPIFRAKARAGELGAEVILRGTFPTEESLRALFALAIREATSNCLRHAGGRHVFADSDLGPACAVLMLTNDGKAPAGPIREGGGLTGLRRRVERLGGEMSVRALPRFVLEIAVPEKKEEP